MTKGRLFSWKQKKTSFRRLASFSRSPSSTVIPAFFRISKPLPETSGKGSFTAATTREMLELMIISVQAGVLPMWQQGSKLTYRVAPLAAVPAFSSARRSACFSPEARCQSSAISLFSRTTTAPTMGLGEVLPCPLAASSRARFMKNSSFGMIYPVRKSRAVCATYWISRLLSPGNTGRDITLLLSCSAWGKSPSLNSKKSKQGCICRGTG